MAHSVATPALFCHKDLAEGFGSLLLGAFLAWSCVFLCEPQTSSAPISLSKQRDKFYISAQVASAFGMLPLFQSPMNILCEISNISKRGFVICVICIAWFEIFSILKYFPLWNIQVSRPDPLPSDWVAGGLLEDHEGRLRGSPRPLLLLLAAAARVSPLVDL